MEVCSCSSPMNLKALSSNSLFISQFPLTASTNRNQIRYKKNFPFPNYLPSSTKRSFLVFSHFSRTTIRRNSLRKKLIEDHKNQVRHVPCDIQHPSPSLDGKDTKLDKNIDSDSVEEVDSRLKALNSKTIGDSVMSDKLKSWVEQYKRDSDFRGVRSEPNFTDFKCSGRNVESVSVDKEEILRRGPVERRDLENSKVSEAESLSSSAAKFVVRGEKSSLWDAIRDFGLSPKVVKEFPRAGIMLLYGFVAVWALRRLFEFREKEVKLTESEKEMMRRKIKSRNQREALEKDYVEVVREPSKPVFLGEKPKLDKQELAKDIMRAKMVASLPDSSVGNAAKSVAELDVKIQEIREMAREAREIESAKNGSFKNDEVENQSISDEGYEGIADGEDGKEEATRFLTRPLNGDREQSSDDSDNEAFGGNGNVASREESIDFGKNVVGDLNDNHSVTHLTDNSDVSSDEFRVSRESSVRVKPRIIRSVKEARAYLSENNHSREGKEETQFQAVSESDVNQPCDKQYGDGKRRESASEDSTLEIDELVSIRNGKPKSFREREDGIRRQGAAVVKKTDPENTVTEPSEEEETWNENNIDEQIVRKIGVGFRDNFMAARENKDPSGNAISSLEELRTIVDRNELDWMEDDRLAEIVFQVRENELAGYDPFHKLDAKDKDAFFKGLEKKVERENEKMLVLHKWLHSNIENLDYGVDGISVYDPPEKIIPRWKGPLLEKSPEFLNNFHEQRNAIFAEYTGISNNANNEDRNQLQKSSESQLDENIATSSAVSDPKKKKLRASQRSSKTIIESSDGTVKHGKKSGKEFWQHTKKWSRGFVESFNAETDPEVKSTMRDIGKGLDRWITEKEIQESSDLMDKFSEKGKEFMEKKLGKLKREMELFGPQAVASKYSEYTNNDQEDYLWWLDLPHILCIELYTAEENEQRIGFYSLEMATDLELEPKPHHVIAFEDAGDCKNLCYIIQAKMETLGNGCAFVVARPPKDAFREAKENGFSVSVIRKGELELNVDQTLEEVEEQICEIGSKLYHDMIMRDRSVDISSLMKGVFGFNGRPTRPKRKLSKKMLKKRGKK